MSISLSGQNRNHQPYLLRKILRTAAADPLGPSWSLEDFLVLREALSARLCSRESHQSSRANHSRAKSIATPSKASVLAFPAADDSIASVLCRAGPPAVKGEDFALAAGRRRRLPGRSGRTANPGSPARTKRVPGSFNRQQVSIPASRPFGVPYQSGRRLHQARRWPALP